MQAPVAAARCVGSIVLHSKHAGYSANGQLRLSRMGAAEPSGLRMNGVRRAPHCLRPCRAEAGKNPQDRVIKTDPAVGQAEVVDVQSAESGSGGESVWDSKPPWCQPWTIVLTGATIDAFTWKASGGSLLITGLVGCPIFVWWWLFLGVMPQAYAEYAEQIAAEGRRQGDDAI